MSISTATSVLRGLAQSKRRDLRVKKSESQEKFVVPR